ncbi:cytochrome P450 [Aspergillus falconensis]
MSMSCIDQVLTPCWQNLRHEYGPIYSLMLGTQCLVVLSSDEAVKELLDRRGGIYSHRQEMYTGQLLCSGGLRMLIMGYGPTCRNYLLYQMLENKQMLHQFLAEPHDFLKHIRRYSNALTTTTVFGWRTPTYEDPKMKQLFDGFSQFAELNQAGAAAFLDFFPCCKSCPISWCRRSASQRSCISTRRPSTRGTGWRGRKDSDDQAAYISGTLLEAGSDTTSSTLYAFVQAMLLYPDVQRKAQAGIDRVIGPDRLPVMHDLPDLQYIRACMETLRWMPTTILRAVPHAVTQDDSYMGYFIPRGTGVMNNVWAIHHDEKRHPKPRQFNPDWYKDDTQSLSDAATNPDASKRDASTFGAARRICLGIHVAERSLFLGMSRILWAFDISPKKDANGKEIVPYQERLTQGFVCMPEEFPANITPRDEKRAEMVRNECREAEMELDPQTKQRSSPLLI